MLCQGDDAAAGAENMAESPDVTDPAEATEVRLAAAYEAFKLVGDISGRDADTRAPPLPPQEDADD